MSFGELIKIIQEEGAAFNPEMPGFGEVVSVNPLKVSYGDIELDSEDLQKNKDLTLVLNAVVLLMPIGSKYLIVCEVVDI